MKKILKIIGIVLVLGIIFFGVDYSRLKNSERPIPGTELAKRLEVSR